MLFLYIVLLNLGGKALLLLESEICSCIKISVLRECLQWCLFYFISNPDSCSESPNQLTMALDIDRETNC